MTKLVVGQLQAAAEKTRFHPDELTHASAIPYSEAAPTRTTGGEFQYGDVSRRSGRSLRETWPKIIAEARALWYLRRAKSVGTRTRVWGRPAIQAWGNLTIGKRVQFVSTLAKLEIVVEEHGILEIGDDVYINYGSSIAASREVRIGAGSLLGMHVMLMDNDFHRLEPERRRERPESAPIILEENVWLGARVIVLRGVTIGANSAIAAGSVVTRDIPPNVIAAGVPARVLRTL